MLSHQRHQGVIRIKTEGLACVREGGGHDSDLFFLECSSS
jgi:hypothetical protein